ncbi:hypothetical protein MMC19_005045 [Ptychographa xylographoides]|nr:hypothetical protein [Ptychographa xylographoides]
MAPVPPPSLVDMDAGSKGHSASQYYTAEVIKPGFSLDKLKHAEDKKKKKQETTAPLSATLAAIMDPDPGLILETKTPVGMGRSKEVPRGKSAVVTVRQRDMEVDKAVDTGRPAAAKSHQSTGEKHLHRRDVEFLDMDRGSLEWWDRSGLSENWVTSTTETALSMQTTKRAVPIYIAPPKEMSPAAQLAYVILFGIMLAGSVLLCCVVCSLKGRHLWNSKLKQRRRRENGRTIEQDSRVIELATEIHNRVQPAHTPIEIAQPAQAHVNPAEENGLPISVLYLSHVDTAGPGSPLPPYQP